MTTLSWVPRITVQTRHVISPTITAGAYTANFQVGGVMTLTNVVRQDSGLGYGTVMLNGVKITDYGKQSAAFDIWFFQNSPTMTSIDHQAFDISDVNLAAALYLGHVSVGSAYSTSSSNSVSTDSNLNVEMHVNSTSTTPSTIYAVAKTTGTPTYASTSDLTFKFSFFVD